MGMLGLNEKLLTTRSRQPLAVAILISLRLIAENKTRKRQNAL